MSIIKKTFGRYFPSILSLPEDAKSAKVKIKIGNKEFDAEIDDHLFININKLPEKFNEQRKTELDSISFDEFIYLFEGKPYSDTTEQTINFVQENKVMDIGNINSWSQNLFSENGNQILENLKAQTGLTEDTIREYKLGFDTQNNQLVFPFLNFTSQEISAINFYSVDNLEFIKNYGGDGIFGYHEIINNKYNLGHLYFANNEFDAILLRQLGYNSISTFVHWRHDFERILKQFHIIIFYKEQIDQVNWKIGTWNPVAMSLALVELDNKSITDLVAKEGYNKEKLDQLISKKQMVDIAYYNNFLILKNFNRYGNKKTLQFSQFLHNKIQYYGITSDNNRYLLNTNRDMEQIDNFLAMNPEINLDIKIETASRISIDGLDKFLLKNYLPERTSAFYFVRNFIKDYIYFPNEITYDLVSLWTIGTYIFLNFKYYPYLHLQAPRNSGKSTLLDLLGKICFNATHQINPTAPVLFRQIDNFQSSILIDEVEDFKSNSSQKEILQILNQGYAVGGRVPRIKGDQVTYFNVYSPKAFGGISKINDVLQSRTIKVQIEQKPSNIVKKRSRTDNNFLSQIQKIIDELYFFGLIYADEVESEDKKIMNLPQTSSLNNRELDTWAALFATASVVDRDSKIGLLDNLEKYIEIDRELKKSSLIDKNQNLLHDFLFEYLKNNVLKKTRAGKYVYSSKELFNKANSASVLPPDIQTINKLTMYLKQNYGIVSENVDVNGDKNKKYVILKDSLKNHFNIDFEPTIELLNSTNNNSLEATD